MTSSQLIEEVKSISTKNIKSIDDFFAFLTKEQLAWKINEASWSINEIFAHLNKYASYYHQAFKNKISKTKFKRQSDIFISSPLGRSAWKSMKLGNANNIKRKFKAPKTYNPSLEKNLINGKEIQSLKSNFTELIAIATSAQDVSLRRNKIAISISKIIRLRLGDALLFVTYHNERHMQQALNMLNHPKFPK